MRAHRTHRTREAGFTLAEALVAVGLFGIALLGLNMLLIGTLRTAELSRDLATARFLAAHRLEQIIMARYMDGNRDAYRDPADPCTDIDEITTANFPTEDYGEVDLLNGTRFNYRNCAAVPDIRQSAIMVTAADYPATAHGRLQRELNHDQYRRFRREVYIVDSADYTDAIVNVTLDGPSPNGPDNVIVETTTPSASNPATNYVKYVLVRVKWKDSRGAVHAVTLSTEKSFLIPAS
ncbi:MAG: hypothetical protein Kow0062_19880 [Acidobacteriota bacterium]